MLHGIDLAAKADALVSTMTTGGNESVPAARGDAERVRLLLEGRTEWGSAASRVVPRLEVGGRWDRGDVARGVGVEVGGGLVYTRPAWGLHIDGQGRYLVAHEEGAYEDWGASVQVRLAPGPAGQGVYLTVAPVWGEAASGVERLWGSAAGLEGVGGGARPGAAEWAPDRVEVEGGYGLELGGARGLVTPYGGLALAGPVVARYRLGGRLALSASLNLSLEGERAKQPGEPPSHSVSIHLRWQW